MQNASQKSLGDKNKEVRGWAKFKIVATRCHILRQKCTKFDFGWGPTSKGREGQGQGRERREGREGGRKGRDKGREGKERKGEGSVAVLGKKYLGGLAPHHLGG